MRYVYRVVWYDWHEDMHVAYFVDFDDAVTYAGDIIDNYTDSHIQQIDFYDVVTSESKVGNPHPRRDFITKEKET